MLAQRDLPHVVDALFEGGARAPLPTPAVLADTSQGWWDRYVAMTWGWLEQMRTAAPSTALVEKMTLFWHGHFCSSLEKVGDHLALWNQNQLFRTRGLGSFRDLTQAVAVDPAMLRYLDNARNVSGAPNENFARESMELFTLGAGNYTQDDVVAVARAWTGHGVDDRGNYLFRPERHDAKDKTIFGITRRWNGPEVLDEILRGAKRDIAARHIVTKVWSFFAYPDPGDDVVDALVAPFLFSGLDIETLLRAMFLRPEFYSPAAKGALVRSPIEYVVAAMQGTGLGSAQAHPEWYLASMGQQPFAPPNVAGWKSNDYWISTSAQSAKAAFAGYLRWQVGKDFLAGSEARSNRDAVRTALGLFGIDSPAPSTTAAMEAWLRVERTSTRWAERPNLLLLALLSPDAQLA